MILRVFWTGLTESKSSLNYQDFECETWEATPMLLIIHQAGGARYLPWSALKGFKECPNE